MTLIPLNDRVLVKPEPLKDETPSGIVLPNGIRDNVRYGEVWYGPTVLAGKRVMWPEYTGLSVTIDGEACVFLKEEELLAIVED